MQCISGSDDVALRLDQLPKQYRWAFADQSIVLAISRGEQLERGVMGSRLCLLVKWAFRLKTHWLLLLVVGAMELVRLLLAQRKGETRGDVLGVNWPNRFFVGFGAGSEDDLFRRYCDRYPGQVGRLDQIDVRSFGAWHRLGLVPAFRSLIYVLGVARLAIASLPPDFWPWRVDFITFIGMRLGYFAYMRGWFNSLREHGRNAISEVAFLAADTAAFAAVDAGLPARYIQHGLLPYSVALPEFSSVDALNNDEAIFMQAKLPHARIGFPDRSKFTLRISQMRKEVLITSIYGTHEYMFMSIDPFIRWAADNGLPVRVRPHPRESHSFWESYSRRGMITIENGDPTFLQSIKRLRPRINVSWFSTTLADSLDYGIIPVTVCADDDREVNDTVYPLFRRSLRWPQDMDIIERVLVDDNYYEIVLFALREEFIVEAAA